ncbi:leucine-rich repeat-containing protein 24-like [Haliotis asinina]|uniref:leucine-rich repeat-containing protein 24-like n=1 Tax=Haliotis asinina TaxID=109174 RepID=UPI003531CEA9
MMGRLVYLSFFICVFVGVSSDSGSCPMECNCNTKTMIVTCEDNDLTTIPSGLPTDMTTLVISGTTSVPFDKLTNLKRQDVKNAKDYHTVIITNTALISIDADAFQDLQELRMLTLKGNKISKLHRGTFDNLPNLDSLDLSGNDYCNVEAGTFANIPSLHFLYLGDMKLGHIDLNSFQHDTSLHVLDLHGNDFRKLPSDLFSHVTSLETLDLSNNKLKTLPKEYQSFLTDLDHLDLSDNPWQCNCALDWMRNLPQLSSAKIGSHTAVECYGPDRLKFQSLVDIPSSDLLCIPPNITCNGPVTVQTGDAVSISCETSGDPEPYVTWVVPDSTILDDDHKKSGYRVEGNVLTIQSASSSDDGNWTVKAFSVGGSVNTTVVVEVEEPEEVELAEADTDIMPIIIGASVGGILLLAGAGLLLYIRHRKKKDEVKPFKNDDDSDDEQQHIKTKKSRNVPPHATRLR